MNALRITRKDLRLLVRDRRALVVLLILPLVLIAVIGSSTGRLMGRSASTAGQQIRILVRDHSQSDLSRRLLRILEAAPGTTLTLDGSASDGTTPPRKPAAPPVAWDTRLVIGSDFATHAAKLPPHELLQLNPGHTNSFPLQYAVRPESHPLLGRHMELLVRDAFRRAASPLIAEQVPELSLPNPEPRLAPTNSVPDTENASSENVYQFVVPGYTVLFVFFLVTVMGRSFIQERELGTLRRLRLAPVSPVSILVGKTLPFLLLSVVQTLILLSSGWLIFGMSPGHRPLLLLPVVVMTSLAATTLGLAFASWVHTDSQVSAMGNLIVLATAGISGCLVPRDWMPELSQKISLVTPHAWALDAYRELLSAGQPRGSVVAWCCLVLLLFSAVFFVMGLSSFRRQPQ